MEDINADEALERLGIGNSRYHGGESQEPHLQEHRDSLIENGQRPFACVIGCSDSRTAPETVFHARLGDLFTIRTAGNVIGKYELGSIEYAVCHLGVPLVIVMGHTHCGAVHAAVSEEKEIGALADLVAEVSAGIGNERDPRRAENLNVMHGLSIIKDDPVLADAIKAGKVMAVGAIYDASSGKVEFISDVLPGSASGQRCFDA